MIRRSIIPRAALLAVLALASACDRRSDAGPVVVSAIGGKPGLADPSRGKHSLPVRLLLDSAAQGLVRFDANGQIEPGIAERWIVIEDGTSYIFRLRDAEWSDGKPVTAEQVVIVLKRQIARNSRNPLLPFLSSIDEIVVMTPEVIEVRLKYPRPDLLKLFAQPEFSVFRTKPPGGSGPFRILNRADNSITLRPAFDPSRLPDEEVEEPGPEANVQLFGESASRAVTRFGMKRSDLVSGGTFANWPLLRFASVAPANIQIDPAVGLFGLAIVDRGGFLAQPGNRAALAQAIDRQGIAGVFDNSGWTPTTQILPEQLDSAAAPTIPAWAVLARDNQLRGARQLVDGWKAAHPGPLHVRIALPPGPGATILYGFIGSAFRSIGVEPERVAINADADLRLIDRVAPFDSARWYLASACVLCSDEAQAALEAARDAPTPAERAAHIAEADAALGADTAFIPLARPVRWSLVALRLRQWHGNPRAWHPLNHLRNDTN